MIEITSNITGVIGRLERFKAAIPGAVRSTMIPGQWLLAARRTAEMALRGVADPNQGSMMMMIPQFVDTVMADVWGKDGMFWRMSVPPGVKTAVPAEGFALEQEATYQDVLNWVTGPKKEYDDLTGGKILTEQDRPDVQGIGNYFSGAVVFDMEDIASRIYMMINRQIPNSNWKGLEARVKSYRMFAEDAGTINYTLWLKAVLDAWVDLIRRCLPQLVRQEIRTAWKQTEGNLL